MFFNNKYCTRDNMQLIIYYIALCEIVQIVCCITNDNNNRMYYILEDTNRSNRKIIIKLKIAASKRVYLLQSTIKLEIAASKLLITIKHVLAIF